jgi:hypothetical protein
MALWGCSSVGRGTESLAAPDSAAGPGSALEGEGPNPPGGGDPELTLTKDEFLEISYAQAEKPSFDGTVLGWRIATHDVLEEEGIHPTGLTRECEGSAAGPETATTFDFTIEYIPPHITIGPVEGPFKSLCDNEPISVLIVYNVATPIGAGQLLIERSILSAPTLEMDVPFDSVEGGEINGKPAIIFHPDDDRTGLGLGRIVVIEDENGTEFTVLSVIADNGFPYHELIKVVEGVR